MKNRNIKATIEHKIGKSHEGVDACKQKAKFTSFNLSFNLVELRTLSD